METEMDEGELFWTIANGIRMKTLGKVISILVALLGWVFFGTIVGISTRTVMLIMHPAQFDR